MNKIVYNDCYGGFSLSIKAAERLIELDVSNKELKDALKRAKSSTGIFSDVYLGSDFPRHDPRLVQVVEELGKEANGRFSDLQIREIDGSQYKIEEYDGMEIVVTPKKDKENWIIIKKKKSRND